MLVKELESQGNILFKYRGQLPILLLLSGMAVYYFGSSEINVPCWSWIALCVTLFGLFIRIYAIGHVPTNTSGRNTVKQVAESVNTSGLYSIVRHPLYVGNFFMWLGGSMLSQSWPFIVLFVLVFWLFYERVMIAEEQFLAGKFGEGYTNWAKRVPPFVPRFSNWQKNTAPFSWKKILKREDTPVLNVTAIFFVFEMLRICKYKEPFVWTNFWVLFFGFGLLQILVLRSLRKQTKVFEEAE